MNTITIRLCPEASEPLYEQIYKYIKQEITEGRYKPDLRLPSKRRLAAHLQCSQNTVQAAYNQLTAEGYISAKPRSGYYVCRLEGIFNIKNELSLKPDNSGSGFSYKYDFSHHGVDLDNFPFATWRKILKDVISEYDADLLKAGGTQGELNLRVAISEYLHNSRGVNCSPGQIIVSSGTEFLLLLLIQLFDDGSVFAIENPGYEKLNLIFKSNRAEYKAVDLDEAGMIPEKLFKSRADIACVTPSHQFPTGLIMPVSRRIQLLNWANEKAGRYIIEDDYDSEFKYGGRPVPSMQGLNGGGKVIYMGAFSKSLTPAIRISYMVLPEKLMELYREKLSFYICPVPAVEQKALYRFISGGYFERHLNRMRNIYKQKRETLIKALKNALPNSAVKGANAGLHLILTVDNGMSEEELILSARNNGVRVYGISQYYFGDAPKDGNTSLLLGFAALREKEIYEATERLRKAWL
ncbi:MAG: PLP-dependent aminotransferase family protein [Bacillota bacterium]|nr:PLP-dependent aminotransferase family protein [Bacillota bacterium]